MTDFLSAFGLHEQFIKTFEFSDQLCQFQAVIRSLMSKYPPRWRTQSLVLAGIQLGRFVNCRHYIGDHPPSSENLRLKTLRTIWVHLVHDLLLQFLQSICFSFCCNVSHHGQMHWTGEKVTEVQEQTMVESGQDFSQSLKITDVGSEAILLCR